MIYIGKNQIVLYDTYAEIILYDRHWKEKARAIIDIEDVPIVEKHRWYQRADGYVATNSYANKRYAYLHGVLLQKNDESKYIDHIDGNRLNNRKSNLRIVDGHENGYNKGIRKNNTSGRVGVHWSNDNQRWCAMICTEGKHINLGYFSKFEDAVKCRRDAEKKLFKQFKADEKRLVKLNI